MSTGRDAFINVVINVVSSLPSLVVFVRDHWLLILVSIGFQIVAFSFWLRYVDRFFIPYWLLIGGMIVLEIGIISTYRMVFGKSEQGIWYFITTIGAGLALAAFCIVEFYIVTHPIAFDRQVFGVAIARFGEGPDLLYSDRAREVSQLVFEHLSNQARQDSTLDFVQFRPIGLVRNEFEALEDAQRLNADLVIWGQLNVSDNQTTLRFAILETPDKVSNPSFPRVVPLIDTPSLDVIALPQNASSDIALSMRSLSSMIFGMAHFFEWNFTSAAQAFAATLNITQNSQQVNTNYLYLLHLYYGLSLQWLDRFDDASQEFSKATQLISDPAAVLGLAFNLRSQGQTDHAKIKAQDAIHLCDKQLSLYKDDERAYFCIAVAHEILEDWQVALEYYQQAVKYEPDFLIARMGVIRMDIFLDEFEDAILAADETISHAEILGANSAWIYLFRGRAHELNINAPRHLDHAYNDYKKAQELAPRTDWIQYRVGLFFWEKWGNLLLAENAFTRMTAVSSNPAWAHTTLAEFYRANKRLNDAAREYENAVSARPSRPALVLVELAVTYWEQGRTDDARNTFERALREEPMLEYAHDYYGNFLFTQGEYAAAISRWMMVLEVNSDNCDATFKIGRAYEVVGQIDQARSKYQEALELTEAPGSSCHVNSQKQLDILSN